MENFEAQLLLPSDSKSEIDRILRRIEAHRGVKALMVATRDGLILRSNLDLATSKQYAMQYRSLAEMAHIAVRDLDPENKLQFVRVRNKAHEIMVAPSNDLLLIVVQRILEEQ